MTQPKQAGFPFQLDEFYQDLSESGDISFLEQEVMQRQPFPGLRPFKTSEFELFHGREGQAEELVNRLKKNHFLAVVGSSGTGKSSLIRAGLVPQLLGGSLTGAGTKWDIAICRPGKNPLENLAIALAATASRSNSEEKILEQYRRIEPMINSTFYGILDVKESLNQSAPLKQGKSNLLIIIDQFEELVRFKRTDLHRPDLESHFVNLLLKAAENPESGIYVIITMRSEFLGDVAKYRGLPEAINKGQYLVPQLSRPQIREAIVNPIMLAGKEIEPGLAELLTNEIESSKAKEDLDQLPILQHALMLTFRETSKNPECRKVTYEHYQACGGMEKALANHAESKYAELSDGKTGESRRQKIAKIIFQALTNAESGYKGGRRPTELKIIYKIAESINATPKEVDEVVEHFRDTDTSFIMPPRETPLTPGLILDISHESLMRQWNRLGEWLAEEAGNAQALLRLAQARNHYAQGERDLLVGTELDRALNWLKVVRPRSEWAERYAPDYPEVFAYLEKSRVHRLNQKRKKKLIVSGSILGLMMVSIAVVVYMKKSQARHDQRARLTAFENQFFAAANNENNLQAILLASEILPLERDKKMRDSVVKTLGDYELRPIYSLTQIINCTSTILWSGFGPGDSTVYTWASDGTYSEYAVSGGNLIRKTQLDVGERELEKTESPYVRSFKAPYFAQANDKVEFKELFDSSRYFAQKFYDLRNRDETLTSLLPTVLKSIAGAYYSNDSERIITWGTNTESMFEALNTWGGDATTLGASMLHDGVNGAIFSHDKNLILSWGADSSVRIWNYTNEPLNYNLPSDLLKIKMQMETGAKISSNYGVEIIHKEEHDELKKQFQEFNERKEMRKKR